MPGTKQMEKMDENTQWEKTQGTHVCVVCPFKQRRKVIAYNTCNQVYVCVCVFLSSFERK